MNIQLDKYRITSDNYNYTIEEKRVYSKDTFNKDGGLVNKAGAEYWATVGHYGSFSGLMEGLSETKLKRSDATSFVELARVAYGIKSDLQAITDAFKGLK
jgi:hypothetical protein